ncbi:MAG: glycosyltransferase family 1 protein [Pseudomonadota bacterium]
MTRPDPLRPVVHWVCPIPPAQTDIAHYTARILPALAQHARVILWTDANRWDPSLAAYARIERFDPDTLSPRDLSLAARRAGAPMAAPQAVFIHIGNAWVFHAGLIRLARRVPSIVVLHDLAIQEMLNDAMRNGLFPSETYRAEMADHYGEAGAQAAARVLNEPGYAHQLAPDMPGFQLALPRAVSALAHTPAAVAALQAYGRVPVHHLELPFQPGRAPDIRRPNTGPLRFLQFGYIGPNRRLFEIIAALGEVKDRVDFRFDVMGHVWDRAAFRTVVAQAGLEDRVHLRGFVPEARLDAELRLAHLVFNLRYPTLGEASGSQLRIWNAGAAAVVHDAGWYSTLPEDTVFRIPNDLDQEKDALKALVLDLAQDRSRITPLQIAGRAQLDRHHHPQDYARAIAGLARAAGAEAAQMLERRALQRAGLGA